MKGLLVKDFALFNKVQKKTMLITLLMVIVFAFTGVFNGTFLIGYLPILFCLYAMSSISYDEFDNGLSFLMVLPVTRKQYVTEKYVFGICLGIGGILLALVLMAAQQVKDFGTAGLLVWLPEGAVTTGAIMVAMSIFLSIMIPVQLKFGSEKGRMVLFALFIGVFAIGCVFAKYMSPVLENMDSFLGRIENADGWVLGLIFAVITLAALLISYRISVHVMEKKEF